MSLMEEKISALPGQNLFTSPQVGRGAVAVWGVDPYREYAHGDVIEIEWKFPGPTQLVDVTLYVVCLFVCLFVCSFVRFLLVVS
jgi:hypothetical protein